MNKLASLAAKATGKKSQYDEIQDATMSGGTGVDIEEEPPLPPITEEQTPLVASPEREEEQQQQQRQQYQSQQPVSLEAEGYYAPRSSSILQTTTRFLLRNSFVILLLIAIAVLIALARSRSSHGGGNYNHYPLSDDVHSDVIIVERSGGDKNDHQEEFTSGSSYRPCQIYVTGSSSSSNNNDETASSSRSGRKVRVIQTSLGQPSLHWTPVPCFYTKDATRHRVGWNQYVLTFPATRSRQHQHYYRGQNQNTDTSDYSNENEEEQQPIIRYYEVPDAEIQLDYASGPAHPDRPPIMGFGGAFTQASALNYMSLSEEGRKAVMDLLFGKNGLGYSLGRVHMNSCDFCVESYAYSNTDGDFDLADFDTSVTHDVDTGMVDMMLEATKVVRENWPDAASEEEEARGKGGSGMRIIMSPWSPPPWMKAPTKEDPVGALHAENMTDSASPICLRDGTGPDSKYAQAWALHFSKFIDAYKDLGLHLFGVTVQNEPEFPAPWEACAYTPEAEGEFVANHLGPLLKGAHPEIKLFIFDHNKDHAPTWAKLLLNSSHPASTYIDGMAIHWYAGGMDRLLDGAVGTPNMHRLVSDLDDLGVSTDHIIFGSEACHCPSTGYAGGDLKVAWDRAQRYAHTVLADLAAGSNGWIEWNLILDSIGGPNHLGNVCDSPLLAVPHRAKGAKDVPDQMSFETHGHPFGPVIGDQRTRDELNALGFPAEFIDAGVVVQPMYYYMGHISRHVRPGSRAVKAIVDSSSKGGREARAFRPAGQVVAGGGINDLARPGIELTMWPCEGSTRQQFVLNENNQLQVFGHDWLGNPTKSCISKMADKDFEGLVLKQCKKLAGTFEVVPQQEGNTTNGIVTIGLTNGNATVSKSCLVLQPLKNGGGANGPRGGAQINVGDCSSKAAEWTFNQETGEISSNYFADEGGEVCLTTGWPFLQVGAFDTPVGDGEEKAVVILNEAGEAANYILRDGQRVIITASIPPYSIQTVLFD